MISTVPSSARGRSFQWIGDHPLSAVAKGRRKIRDRTARVMRRICCRYIVGLLCSVIARFCFFFLNFFSGSKSECFGTTLSYLFIICNSGNHCLLIRSSQPIEDYINDNEIPFPVGMILCCSNQYFFALLELRLIKQTNEQTSIKQTNSNR